ncbi:MAG: NPCBM/NEW2 domain-containing protein [Oscillospiraceae bacterium]|nr:NPCBM/NEW2 domain-containing protein [Oscillospiraceae bacterium]
MKILKRGLSLILTFAMLIVMFIGVLPGEIGDNISLTATALDSTDYARKIAINDGWRFRLLTASSINDATSRGLDSTGMQDAEPSGTWTTINLPHDWSIYQNFGTGGSRVAQGYLPGGTAWYRRTFTLTSDYNNKNVVLQFDTVRMVSQIYINGTHLGNQHQGNVTFEYDITPYLRPAGQENVIALKVLSGNNSARWYAGAGIPGGAYLIVTDKVYIPVNGVHVQAVVDEKGNGYVIPDFNNPRYRDAAVIAGLKQQSSVNVRTEVANKTTAAATVSVKSTIYGLSGDVAIDQSSAVSVAAGGSVKIDQLIQITNPKLWSVDEPNLYWVKSEIIQNGEVIDTIERTQFGIRYLYLKPGSRTGTADQQLGGFFINGEYVRINGMCEHRDLGGLGMETYQAACDRRIRALKAMGVNCFRTAHNPMSAELLDACERIGMLVCEEATDMWTAQKNGEDYSRWFVRASDASYGTGTTATGTQVIGTSGTAVGSYLEWYNTSLTPNAVRDIQAMVKRDRNSPAVILWSTGNEIYDTQHDYGLDVYSMLSAAISEVDSYGVYSNTLFTSSNPGVGNKVSPVAGDPYSWRDIIGNQQGSTTSRVRTIREIAYYPNSAYPSSQNTTITAEPIIRRARPILSAPPTWDSEGTSATTTIKGTSASRSGMERNEAWADVGGDNYSHGDYNSRKDRNPWMLVGGTETSSAFYARGKYSLTSFDSGVLNGSRVNSPTDTGSYSSEYPSGWNFVSAPVSVREHRMDQRPFVYGEMNWTGHDYLGEPTPWGSPAKSSSFGIIDTAGFEKDSFYMYRSAWTDIPTVHILPQKWNWTVGTQIPIMIYTNGRSVELFVNGVSVSTMNYNKATSNPIYLYFGKFAYAPGSLKAVAYSGPDRTGNVIATDEVYTAGDAQRIELTADRAFMKNDKTDLVYVEAVITDSAGVRLPDAVNRITWNVQGGEIVALDNGDPRDNDRHRPVDADNAANPPASTFNRRAFSGKALAIIRPLKGSTADIIVTATAPDGNNTLNSNTVTVGSRNAIGDGYGVYDSEKVEVTTGVGIPPVLPSSIGTIYDNGLIEQFKVDSWDLSEVNLGVPGTYTAYGSQLASAGTVEATVNVKEFEAVADISVTTIAGISPPLPQFVTLHFKDGTIGAASVTWAAINPSQYAAINTFDVIGNFGPSLTLTAHVTVKDIDSVLEEPTVYTTPGVNPEMPASVMVRFSDGTSELMPVDWTVAASDYAVVGKKQVSGKMLGTINVTAIIIVRSVNYLSDINWVSSSGTVVKDKTVGNNALGARGVFGGPPVEYAKGLGTLAPFEAVYDIAGLGYDYFSSYISLSMDDGGMTGRGAVAFEVYLDGALAYESGAMDRQSEAILVNLPLAGVSQLKIVTKGVGTDGAEFDLGDWCDAKFLSDPVIYDVTFNLYGGNIGGSTSDIKQYVAGGVSAAAPSTSPTRLKYSFVGWNTNRLATTAQTVANVTITGDTTFYAIWSKLSGSVSLVTIADAGLKTWQSEKNSNYGGDTNMLIRAATNTGTNGLFGQNFTSTSTSDSTDIKTVYIKFDVAALKGLSISSASLNLRYTGNTNSGGAGGNTNLYVARVVDSNWVESSITWSNRPRTLYGNVGSSTASDVAVSGTFSAAQSTGVSVSTDVLKLYNTLPATDNAITFAVTLPLTNRDYQIQSKEGSTAAYRPTLALNIATWSDYLVTYDLNGGSGQAPVQPTLEANGTFIAAGARTIAGPTGRVFKEWNTAADGSGTSYNPGDTVTIAAANFTLYAIWSDDAGVILSCQTSLDTTGIVTVRSADPGNTNLWIAAYNEAGAMIKVSSYPLNANGGQEQDVMTGFNFEGAASVRVFLWDTDFIPLCAAKTVYTK